MISKKKDTFRSNAVQNRFTAYLITAIHRKKADYLEKIKRIQTYELMPNTDQVFESGGIYHDNVMDTWGGFQNDALEAALKRLSVREQYVVFARVIGMRGFAEIGSKLGIEYQGVAAVYYRAIRKIKGFVERGDV